MSDPAFMSGEHVDAMNVLLDASGSVHEASAALDRTYVLHYDLTDGPSGGRVHWTMTFAPDGVRFGLEAPERADLVVSGRYADAVAAARASREGRTPPVQMPMEGDLDALRVIGPTFAAAQAAATIAVRFDDA